MLYHVRQEHYKPKNQGKIRFQWFLSLFFNSPKISRWLIIFYAILLLKLLKRTKVLAKFFRFYRNCVSSDLFFHHYFCSKITKLSSTEPNLLRYVGKYAFKNGRFSKFLFFFKFFSFLRTLSEPCCGLYIWWFSIKEFLRVLFNFIDFWQLWLTYPDFSNYFSGGHYFRHWDAPVRPIYQLLTGRREAVWFRERQRKDT